MKNKVFTVLLGLTLSASAFAQPAPDGASRLESLEHRLAALENASKFLPKISGFVNVRYYYDESSDANSFDIRRTRLDIKGNITPEFDYRFQSEFAGGAQIRDAYLRYKPSSYINVQVGQFKIPFTLENVDYGPASLELADNAIVISKLSDYSDLSGISSNGRDIGISLYGSFLKREGFNLIDYRIGLFNGNGINTKDNNKTKDFVGRIDINPLKELTLSGSYYTGKYGDQSDSHYRERVAAGLRWVNEKLILRSEYIFGKTAGTKSEGVYVLAGYKFVERLQALVRYDFFQKNRSESASERDYTIGLNYWAHKKIRLQANYAYKSVESSDNYSYVTAQLFVQF